MELVLTRTYQAQGTNGELREGDLLLCYTIELPWRGNQREVSCIPEGSYLLSKRYHPHYGWHLMVNAVPGREWILIHPATDAALHLKGCIAPVSVLTGAGKGTASRIANERLRARVYEVLAHENVCLTIQSKKR